ncbi:uncharacterized protein LOC134280048 [Saccostrea cucullata]|uniref:uncharacterized protein LOC134280048 n=1 Tax=Saccostrea cuccullata TaxID=36930 RepID=UPI002ED150F6
MKEVLPRYAPGKRNYRESPSKRRRLRGSQDEEREKFWQNYQVSAKENTPPPAEHPNFRSNTETLPFSPTSENSRGDPLLPRSIEQYFLPISPKEENSILDAPNKENNIPDKSNKKEFSQPLCTDKEIYLDPRELSKDSVVPCHLDSESCTKGACFQELSESYHNISMTEESMEQDMLTRIIDRSPRKVFPGKTKTKTTSFLSLLCCILPNDDHVLTSNVYRHKK